MANGAGSNIMIKKILHFATKHVYLVAAGVVLVAFALLGNVSNKISLEMVTAVVLCYFLSAVVHHLHDKTLTFEVVIEYILLAGLMLVILVSFFI
jgi:predicted PurR-regulated permease PerM